MTGPLSPDTRSRLWLPPRNLTACLRGVMTRSTLGVPLDEAQRFNHLPATPLCSLTWWFEGEARMQPAGPATGQPVPAPALPQILWAGPFPQPVTSWNPGPVHSLTVLLLPDAMHRLTGLRVQDWVNRWDDARAVLPADWIAMSQALLAEPDDDTRVARLHDFLAPRWQAVRPALPMQAHRYRDWAQSLAMHAALTGPGRSLRQMERRIKRWAGLPMRELRGIGRAEQVFFETLAATEQGQVAPNWAELADASGYADQSHLCRETRRITGFSPDELYRRILGDESFWSYRLWQ